MNRFEAYRENQDLNRYEILKRKSKKLIFLESVALGFLCMLVAMLPVLAILIFRRFGL